jgi:hypothetical protein
VFVGAIDDLFLIATGLSALGALIALLLRSGPAPVPRAGLGPPATAPVANGKITVEGRPVPTATTGNGSPAPQADRPLNVGIEAPRHRSD